MTRSTSSRASSTLRVVGWKSSSNWSMTNRKRASCGFGPRRHRQLVGVQLDQVRKTQLLAEPRGDLLQPRRVLLGRAARAQQCRELARQPRDRRVQPQRLVLRRGVGARRADHRHPVVAGAGNAEAAQFGHHAGQDQRGLARARTADDGHELRLAQAIDDLAHLALAAEEQDLLVVEEGPQPRIGLGRRAACVGFAHAVATAAALRRDGSRFMRRSRIWFRKRCSRSASDG